MATPTRTYPPGPRKFSLGDLTLMQHDLLGFTTKLAYEYGDTVYVKILGPLSLYLLNYPDDIRNVLATHHYRFHRGRTGTRLKPLMGEGLFSTEGELHRYLRQLLLPAFHRQHLATFASTIVEYTRRISENWQDGNIIDLSQEMKRLTLAIISKILFDVDIEAEASELRKVLTALWEIYNRYVLLPFAEVLLQLPLPNTELLLRLPLPSARHFWHTRSQLDDILYRIIEDHQTYGENHRDILSVFLVAQEIKEVESRMSLQQVRDQTMTLLVAGSETMAMALTWAWHLLSRHSEAEDKLQAELAMVLRGRLPSIEDLPHLKYTEMVLAETMRLYPPVYALNRCVVEKHEVGQYTIPVGANVMMSQYIVHRDPRFYPDPQCFNPERFTSEAKTTRPQFAYFPFGGGPRRCIGESLAWMEGVLVLATLAQRWQFHPLPDQLVKTNSIITLRFKEGMHVIAKKLDTLKID